MAYIVVEGLDLSGKTSLCKRLKKHYQGETVYEPFDQTRLSRKACDSFKQGKAGRFLASHQMLISRVELFEQVGEKTQPDYPGYFISDRNFMSTMVYQSYTEDDMKDILELNQQVVADHGYNIFPDILILIDQPHAVLTARSKLRENPDALDDKVLSKAYYYAMMERYHKACKMVLDHSTRTTVLYYDHRMNFTTLTELIDEHMQRK